MRTLLHLFLITVLFSALLICGTTGKIAGKVTDSKTGEPIPAVAVTLIGTTLGAATDVMGNYVILNVPPGTYALQVNHIGYQSSKVVDVRVSVDYTTTINFPLKESAVELEVVEVRGERNPLIRQDQTNPVVAIAAEDFQALPVNEISEVIGLQAGIVVDDDGEFHVRGGRSNEISYTLNGIAMNNPFDNQSSIGVATNALQEVSVSTGTFNAEYGNALSGVVNYVTREGGPSYTGSIKIMFGDYLSTRKDVFPNIDRVDPLNQVRIEGTAGGPIPALENSLSFYASGVYEHNGGYLYGTRIYNPTDFIVNPSALNWSSTTDANGKFNSKTYVQDALGTIVDSIMTYIDPRSGGINDPYYFNPIGRSRFDTLPSTPTGDGELVPFNTSASYNIQANISYRIGSMMKIKYEIVVDHRQSYNPTSSSSSAFYYSYRFNPDGRPQYFNNGIVHAFDWTHTLSNTLFYTVKGSYNRSEDKIMTFKELSDSRYLPGFYQTTFPGTGFLSGGTYLGRTTRSTETMTGKIDVVGQFFEVHEVKLGLEARLHSIDYENYDVQFVDVNDPTKVITDFYAVYRDSLSYRAQKPDISAGYINYNKKPKQFSAYVQDKIELAKSLIVNAGIRYEYFNPTAKYNTQLGEEYSKQDTTFITRSLKQATVKQSLSPRISIAYPITDQGLIRFSYGHFYQIADLSALYTNPEFRAVPGERPVFGNADVKPQRSVQYEIGLQQMLTTDLRLELVGFYKDVRDYILTQIVVTSLGDLRYEVLTNLSYANSRGITVSLLQRRAPGSLFSGSVDYTFGISEGNRTAPREDFFYSEKAGKSIETFLVPLGFHRTHTLNSTVTLGEPDNWSVSGVFRFQTGAPYTPTMPASLTLQQTYFVQNSSNKPYQWNANLKGEKIISLSDLKFTLFIQIDNLFDTENAVDVYSNSGSALYNANQVANPAEFLGTTQRIDRGDPGLIPREAIDKYYVNPANVSRPRLVRLGMSLYL